MCVTSQILTVKIDKVIIEKIGYEEGYACLWDTSRSN